ncbi:MAG: cell division protein FtsA [Candidatus Omnitrophica bacterium]|nr:cell division protein FtsA [Candidatus Omnitrophota bacterium]
MINIDSLVAGLDIGSAKTTVCLGSVDAQGRVEIHNASMVKTRGMERGVITDLGEVAACIEEVIKKVEAKTQRSEQTNTLWPKKNFKINSVYATISGEHVLGNNTKGMLNLSNRPIEISRKDMRKAIESAKYLSSSIDREILHALAQEYVIDGYKRIKDPLGIYATRLGVNLHILTAELSFITNVVKAINRAGIDVEQIAYSGLATSLATITEQEKQAGVILLELGAGTVNILFFNEGSLQYTRVIPVGGQDITQQISSLLNIDFAQAEELKMQYRSRCGGDFDQASCEDKIIIKKDAANYESITRKELAEIIDKKLDTILAMIKKDIELAGILSRVNCGVVVCGGMSFMDGIIERLEKITKLPVSMGIMRGFVSSSSGMSNIFYATGIGLVMHALNERRNFNQGVFLTNSVFGRIFAKLKNIYEEYF